MSRLYRLTSLSLVAAVLGGVVLAQATPEEIAAAVEARQAHMKSYGAAMMVLGKMAQGETPYDAAAATEAANQLVTLSGTDISGLFPVGSEAGVFPDSEALPAIWENPEDVGTKAAALNAAAVALAAVAGTDLAALQGAMGAVGGACGACHELYRQPS